VKTALDLSPLFTPFTIRGITLANRFIMPAMQRGWSDNGRPPASLIDYDRSRVEGGISMVITESSAIDHPTASGHLAALQLNDRTASDWALCAEAVHEAGGRILFQLWHEGANWAGDQAAEESGGVSLSPSGLGAPGKSDGRAATAGDLQDLKAAYVRSALAAQRAGADGVEIHGAHGFLLDQFLWAETNLRTDGYGGEDPAARARFPAEVIAEIRAATCSDFLISFRFSQFKPADYAAMIGRDPNELAIILSVLDQAGVDLFHASARRFFAPLWPSSDLGLAGWARSLVGRPVIAAGSVGLDVDMYTSWTEHTDANFTGEDGLRELVSRFNNREFDLIAVGRSILGDSQWVRKIREGRYADISPFDKRILLAVTEGAGR
jgi:2,4-dienoyl-CoA reductase-like NADH-dependent reductase (Old Yellow Enzyme family)